MRRQRLGIIVLFLTLTSVPMAAPLEVAMGVITRVSEASVPVRSSVPRVEDDGLAGAEQGVRDNNRTAQFTGQRFLLYPRRLIGNQASAAAFQELRASGVRLFLINLPADELSALAVLPGAADSLFFNIGARDDRLRTEDCRANLLHTAPSRAMEADALVQFLVWKRWSRWFLVIGQDPGDRAYAEALKRAARRFGGKIVASKDWTLDVGAQRTDAGQDTEQREVDAFTRVGDYDILLVADEGDRFGDFLNYRTVRPRPVAGTRALIATPWSGTLEQWGATRFQRRFHDRNGRWMTPLDYAAWLAVRSIGEAATRTGSADAAALAAYLRGPDFKLNAFKGVPVTYRNWNGQLRQPLLIVSQRMLVSVSPQPGFPHRVSPLDTLGFDRSEVHCNAAR